MKTFYIKNIIMLRGDNCFIRKSLLKHHKFSFAFYQDQEKLVCYLHAGVRFHTCYERNFSRDFEHLKIPWLRSLFLASHNNIERFSTWFLDISLIVIFSIFFFDTFVNKSTYWSTNAESVNVGRILFPLILNQS